jgi:hypothetical protein
MNSSVATANAASPRCVSVVGIRWHWRWKEVISKWQLAISKTSFGASIRTDLSGQGYQHAFHFKKLFVSRRMVLGGNVAEIPCEQKMVFEFVAEPQAICKKRCNSVFPSLPQPSATLAGMDELQRRIWLASPNISCLGKLSVSLYERNVIACAFPETFNSRKSLILPRFG